MQCLAVGSLPFLRYGASVFGQGRPSRISPTMIEWLGLRQANTPIKITPRTGSRLFQGLENPDLDVSEGNRITMILKANEPGIRRAETAPIRKL